MCGSNAAANREPQANAKGLVGHKRLEDPLQLIGRNAFAVVADGDDDLSAFRFRPKHQPPLVRCNIGHRLACIDGQIQQELLQLHPIAIDQRQARVEVGGDRDVATDRSLCSSAGSRISCSNRAVRFASPRSNSARAHSDIAGALAL